MQHPAAPPPTDAFAAVALPPLGWDLFCRVIDNHGDAGVCWRLARRLAALGQRVRLWVDDASALAWMAPHGAPPGVSTLPWREPRDGEAPRDIVVEAFGCDPPAGFVRRMAGAARAPVWINLEYLSAEGHALRSHGLASPQHAGPGRGLVKWFYYPGLASSSGGLLHEDTLAAERDRFDPGAWLAGLGLDAAPGMKRVSLFCYEQPALAVWLARWQQQAETTQLLVTPGPAARQVAALMGCGGEPGSQVAAGSLQAHFLPWLSQDGFDRLLWACDCNLVRGEDSLVRALWAGRPFVWQLYPQPDQAHAAKLDAFLGVYLQGAEPALARPLRTRFAHWNGLVDDDTVRCGPEPDPAAWRAFAAERGAALQARAVADGDLALRLCRFVASKR